MQECVGGQCIPHTSSDGPKNNQTKGAFSANFGQAWRITSIISFRQDDVQQRRRGATLLGPGERNVHMLDLLFVCDGGRCARFETQDLAFVVATLRTRDGYHDMKA
jgi:hypothetical protein